MLVGDLFASDIEYHCLWPLQPLIPAPDADSIGFLQVSETNSNVASHSWALQHNICHYFG
ncbi:hypothetical protein BQ8482_210060 [Mesorhizobium delmotii]|uniref:Uncharacterized protein n=1 Tax=Mesorhizobium delmotii TaxID=1631247 RepID=A0A2P9AL05_9HYPH|nr:hypothetical protein BQ8482_210060 [Mesorhizobium delmotii]